jgi:glycosyltransferase involved in cell wall biosynthesis
VLERRGELPQLRESDIVACVSDEVATEVIRLGVDPARVLVSPMSVDPERFRPDSEIRDARRRELGLEDEFVVGWVGSFRQFHGLDILVDAFAELVTAVPNARLLLVGEGLEHQAIEDQAERVGIRESVIFTGAVAHLDVAPLVDAMDAAVVTARSDESFHYSPLKMREYLACGTPVVAPRAGEVPRTVEDGVTALLHDPGDRDGLCGALQRLAGDSELARRLGLAGRELVLETGTWDVQLERLLGMLEGTREGSRPS